MTWIKSLPSGVSEALGSNTEYSGTQQRLWHCNISVCCILLNSLIKKLIY